PRVYEWLASDPANRRVDIIGWRRGAPGKKNEGVHRAITLDMFVEGKPPEPEKKPRKPKAEPVKCRHCGIDKTTQIGWSLTADVCFVCASTDNPPSATRLAKAEEINAAT
ncbi:MAG: hypothetical protein ACREJC_19215, partial [Tepidisphaeraceae bacterium]